VNTAPILDGFRRQLNWWVMAPLSPLLSWDVVGEEYEDQVAQLVTFGEQSLDQQVLLPGSIARHGYVQDFASPADLFLQEVKMLSPGKAPEKTNESPMLLIRSLSPRGLRNPVAPQR
jgi:hypothetical protein